MDRPYVAQYLEHERILREDQRFPLTKLRNAVQAGTTDDVRNLFRGQYAAAYGKDHSFVQALENPSTNYYRIDAALALQYPFVDPARPLFLHLLPFADDGPDVPAHKWRSAEEKFIAYMGGDVETFVHAVGLGMLVPTLSPMQDYKGPFMRSVFEALQKLPETHRPASARAVEYAFEQTDPSPWRRDIARLQDRLERRYKVLKQSGYTIDRGSASSRLPPVVPSAYLRERMDWFDVCAPQGAQDLVKLLWKDLATGSNRERKERLDRLMTSSSLFQQLFQASVLYSRGGSVRTARQDLASLASRLTDLDEWTKSRLERTRKTQKRIEQSGNFVGRLAQRVPLVAEGGLESANEVVDRWVPKCLDGKAMRRALDWVDKNMDKLQPDEKAFLQAREKVQWELSGASVPREDAVMREFETIRELLPNLMAAPKELELARSQRNLAAFAFGGTLTSHALPATKPVFRVVEVTWKLVDRFRARKVPEQVRADMNPGLRVRLDYLQLEGSPFEEPSTASAPPPNPSIQDLDALRAVRSSGGLPGPRP